jgi:periplasmic copper chaperone A
MRSLFAAAVVGLLAAVALANPARVQLDHASSRAMPAGANGVVYLTITDQGEPDTLIGVSSAVAAKAELHESFDDHGVMKMRPVASLLVTPDKPVTLAPGGYHIMLIGLKRSLVAGTGFPITLTFSKAGQVTTTVRVEKTGAPMPNMDHGNMDMTMPTGQEHKP